MDYLVERASFISFFKAFFFFSMGFASLFRTSWQFVSLARGARFNELSPVFLSREDFRFEVPRRILVMA